MRHALWTASLFHARGRSEQEAFLLQHASELEASGKLRPSARGSYWADYASMLANIGDYEAAAEHQQRALDRLEATARANPLTVAGAVQELSYYLYVLDRVDAAYAVYEARLGLGSTQVDVPTGLLLLGLARLQRSTSHPAAIHTYERAMETFVHTLGDADPNSVMARAELATHMMDMGAMIQALPHAEAVADHLVAGPHPPGLQAHSLEHLATIQLALEDHAGTRSTLDRILRLLETRPPVEEDDTKTASDVLSRLGASLAERGLHTEALRASAKGFELYRTIQTSPDVHTIGLATNIGLMLEGAEHMSAAIPWFEQAASLARAIDDSEWLETSLANAARARRQAGGS
jgi:tetratricopeptide (TPR) repeat protein